MRGDPEAGDHHVDRERHQATPDADERDGDRDAAQHPAEHEREHRRDEPGTTRVGVGERHDIRHGDRDGRRRHAGRLGLRGGGGVRLRLQLLSDAVQQLGDDRTAGGGGEHLGLLPDDDRAVDLARLDRGDRLRRDRRRRSGRSRRGRSRRVRLRSARAPRRGPTNATGRFFGSDVTPGQEKASTMTPTMTESTTPMRMTRLHGLWTDAGTASMVTPRLGLEKRMFVLYSRPRSRSSRAGRLAKVESRHHAEGQ